MTQGDRPSASHETLNRKTGRESVGCLAGFSFRSGEATRFKNGLSEEDDS